MDVGIKGPHEAEPVAHDEGHNVGVLSVIGVRGRASHHVWTKDGRGLGGMGDAQAFAGAVVGIDVIAVGIKGSIGGVGGGVGEGVEDIVGGADECCFAVGASGGRKPWAVAGDSGFHGICVDEVVGLGRAKVGILIRDEGEKGFGGFCLRGGKDGTL